MRLRTFSFVKMLRKCPFTVVSLLADLFALCGAAALPVNPDAGSALVGCQLGVAAMALQSALVHDELTCSPAQSSETAIRRGVELATFSSKRVWLALSRPHAFERI